MEENAERAICERGESVSLHRRSMLLLDLPDDVIEHIANLLDKRSFHSFACSHLRLRGVCRNSASLERIKGAVVEDVLIQLVSLNASKVRHLDLSNCWLESKSLKALIKKCHNITKLSVVNSSLKLAHTRDVLGTLEQLEDLSVTITQKGSGKVKFGLYRNIRKIYIEFPPSHRLIGFVGRFLEVCPGVEHLHMNIVGDSDDSVSTNAFNLSAERLNNYRTIILSTNMQDRWNYQYVVSEIFGTNAFVSNNLMRNDSTDGICWLERENANEGEPMLREPLPGMLSHHYQKFHLSEHELHELPDLYRAGQLGLRIYFARRDTSFLMPGMSSLSSLLELDLTGCHLIYSPESWRSLANSSSAVKALALPLCSLCATPNGSYRYWINENILGALKLLKLSKLHVHASYRESDCRYCSSCWVNSKFMDHLSDFHNLEELILDDIYQYEDFLVSVDRPFSMKTVKINLRWVGSGRLRGLGKFLGLCKNLRNFKLGSFDLPLGSCHLWDALCQANLRQLCLSSFFERQIDTQMLKPRISRLFKNLDVFHLHMNRASNAKAIFSLIENEAREVNFSRESRPVRFIHTKHPDHGDNEYIRSPCFPGRNLCSLKNFIATVKPIGWDAD